MAKTSFEFVVIGAPFSVNSAKKQSKKHGEWKREVGRTAKDQWIKDGRNSSDLPLAVPMEVTITTFFTQSRRDVDNVVKPILDGLKKVIYEDDGEIYKLTSQRIDLNLRTRIEAPSPLLDAALEEWEELVHIVLTWETKEL